MHLSMLLPIIVKNQRRGEANIEILVTIEVDIENILSLGVTIVMVKATFLPETAPLSAGGGRRERKRKNGKKSDDRNEGIGIDESEEKGSDTTRHLRPISQTIRRSPLLHLIGKEERKGGEIRNGKGTKRN